MSELVHSSKPVLMDHIVRAAHLVEGVTLGQLRSNRRTQPLVNIRQACMILAYERTNHSSMHIGRFFNRDHSTVLHAAGLTKKANNLSPITREYLVRIGSALDKIVSHSPLQKTVERHLPPTMPSRAAIKWGAVT